MNARMVTDEDEKRRIIAKILPPQIKDYLWFQGEQVETIIDFNRQDTLTKAINVLSSITRYDELKDIAIGAAKSANTEYDREVKRLSKDIGRSEELEKEKLRLEKIVQYGLDEEKELKNNLSIAEEKSENLLNKTKDAQEVKQLQEKRKGILKILSELSEMVNDKQLKFHRKMFRSKWVLKGTESLFHSYSERFSNYQQKKVEEEDEIRMKNKFENEITEKLKSRLPIDVPEPIYIQRMLNEEMCLVCDREAKKNSIPWLKIKELIDRNDKSFIETKKKLSVKQDFSDEFKRLYQNGLSLKHRIEEIDTDINESLKEINDLNIRIREFKTELQKIDEDIQKLLADTSLSVEGANDILAEYSVQNKYVKDFSEKVNRVIQQLDFNRGNLRTINDQLKELVTGEIPLWLKEKKNVLNDFEAISISTRERVFNNLILQLENEANQHYQAMTSGNRSSRGKIKLRRLPNGNYMPEINDNDGKPLLGSNTSNLILVKLAVIMAIISAKNNSGMVSLYTLITDAPTSVFGEDYTIGFCKTISKVYTQSIIMSKEFYKNENLKNQLLTNADIRIGKVYMITPTISEQERDNRNSLSTLITPLN